MGCEKAIIQPMKRAGPPQLSPRHVGATPALKGEQKIPTLPLPPPYPPKKLVRGGPGSERLRCTHVWYARNARYLFFRIISAHACCDFTSHSVRGDAVAKPALVCQVISAVVPLVSAVAANVPYPELVVSVLAQVCPRGSCLPCKSLVLFRLPRA